MPKQNVILLLIVVIVVIGGAFYFFGDQQDAPTGPSEGNPGPVSDLVRIDEALVCTGEHTVQGRSVTTTTYLGQGNTRVDSVVTEPGSAPFNSYTILDQTHAYSWTSQVPGQGTKTSLTEATGNFNFNSGGDINIDAATAEIKRNCEAWDYDATVFTPPSDVNFIDIDQLQGGLQ